MKSLKHICGFDFGTSNSVICAYPDGINHDPILISEPTVLFFPEKKGHESITWYIGQEAIDAYLNSGMKGRFIQSLKSVLHDPDFEVTFIYGVPFSPIDLIELILGYLKQKLEAQLGHSLDTVVMGRPVQFSEHHSEDHTAQRRILSAAKKVGFQDIHFQMEPIGAAFAYELNLKTPQTVLVVDIGGGTTDFTIMNLDTQKTAESNRQSDILSTGGVHIGGDDFDASIMWHKLVHFFGFGSQYEDWGKLYDFPIHFFNRICKWYDIAQLKEASFRGHLQSILRTSTQPEAVKRLQDLIELDLGFAVFKAIESAKKALSQKTTAAIQFDHSAFHIKEPLTRTEFDSYLHEFLEAIEDEMNSTLKKAGLKNNDIDAVFLTGGTSLVNLIQNHISNRFGTEKLVADNDRFTSVAKGLALAAVYTH